MAIPLQHKNYPVSKECLLDTLTAILSIRYVLPCHLNRILAGLDRTVKRLGIQSAGNNSFASSSGQSPPETCWVVLKGLTGCRGSYLLAVIFVGVCSENVIPQSVYRSGSERLLGIDLGADRCRMLLTANRSDGGG